VPDAEAAGDKSQAQRLDVHMGFKAGTGEPVKKGSMLLYAFLVFAALYAAYLSSAGFKSKVDALLGKIKD
jgi:hypothetical protein